MDIRLATALDAPCLASLAVAFRDHLQRAVPAEAPFQESIRRLLAASDAEFYLAMAGSEPLGYALLRTRYSMWASGLEANLEDLFVAPAQRQQGAGKRLVQFALARAQALGCVTVCLDTNEHNLASTRIYAEAGFSAVSRRWQGRQLFYRRELA